MRCPLQTRAWSSAENKSSSYFGKESSTLWLLGILLGVGAGCYFSEGDRKGAEMVEGAWGALAFPEAKAGHSSIPRTSLSGIQQPQPPQRKPGRAQGLLGSAGAGQTWPQKEHSGRAPGGAGGRWRE